MTHNSVVRGGFVVVQLAGDGEAVAGPIGSVDRCWAVKRNQLI